MKKYSYIAFLLVLFSFTSCLTGGMEDLPAFEENEITGIQRVEYRYVSDDVSNASGQKIVKKVELTRSKVDIDEEAGTVSIEITVPAATGSFPETERTKCSLKNTDGENGICVMASLSTAARLSPVEGAPALGTPGDWSKPNKYVVTAANGSTKTWTIQVTKFVK